MRAHVRRLPALARLALAAAFAAAPLGAQLAQSAHHQLTAFSFDNGGGGAASQDMAAHVALEALSTDTMSSQHFAGSFGFLVANDPGVSTHPVLFGVQPAFGPTAGGTPLAISGLHFSQFGAPLALGVEIGGQPATDVTLVSDTLITATSPPGVSGPQDILVSGSLDSAAQSGAFLYTPAIITTPVAPLGDLLELRNYGPVGDQYWTFLSLTTLHQPTKFGELLIGPMLISLLPPTPYPPSDGVSSLSFPVPSDPVLHGITVHFQSLSLVQRSPLLGVLTNSSSTTIP